MAELNTITRIGTAYLAGEKLALISLKDLVSSYDNSNLTGDEICEALKNEIDTMLTQVIVG